MTVRIGKTCRGIECPRRCRRRVHSPPAEPPSRFATRTFISAPEARRLASFTPWMADNHGLRLRLRWPAATGPADFQYRLRWPPCSGSRRRLQEPDRKERVTAYSDDRGKTWRLADHPPSGYRSSVSIVSGTTFAVGPNGEDTSFDYGVNWKSVDTLNLNAAAFAASRIGWAVGPGGTFKRFPMHGPEHR